MYGRIIIYGCGGHARSVLSTLEENKIETEIFFVDENAKPFELINGHKVIKEYRLHNEDRFHVAIGDNKKREKVFNDLIKRGMGVPISVVSKYAVIRNTAQIGKGAFISAFAYIGPDVIIGDNTIINTSSVLEHETKIGRHCHIAPNSTVCGRVRIGDNVMVGAGAKVIENIKITDYVVIGAGATVVSDINKSGVYIGIPAQLIN